jgi:hypothetical protein
MAGNIFEGFSVSHAAILDGTTGAETADIYGIREGSVELDTDSFDNTGDDTILSTWNWFNFATVSITSGYIPFSVISLLTGVSYTSSGTGEATKYEMPLWDERSLNTAPRPMLIRVPSKDAAGMPRNLDFILYKVQFAPFSFDGPSYKDGLVLNYSGKALLSNVDEKGATLGAGVRAVGRLVNSQRT